MRVVVIAVAVLFLAAPAWAQTALRLEDAIAEALRNSPELGAPRDAVEQADRQHRQAAAPFGVRVLPNLSSGTSPGGYDMRTVGAAVAKQWATGTDVHVSASSIDFSGGGTRYLDRGYSIGVSQPLSELFTRTAAAPLESARRAVAATERLMDEARQQLVVSVADAFYSIVRAERLTAASRRAADRAGTLVAASDARAKAGLDTELDVMRARLLASQAASALADHEEELAASRERLNALLGRDVAADITVAPDDAPGVEPAIPSTDAAVVEAIAHRAEAVNGRTRIEDARHAAAISRWNVLPPVIVNVEYRQRGLMSPLQPLLRPDNGWHVMLTSNYQLDRTTRALSTEAADAAVRVAERDARATEQRIAAEARQALRAVTKADQSFVLQEQSRAIAERQLEVANLRYERGLADNVTVVDAENALFQAESACIAAGIERRLARLRVQRATGTLDTGARQ